MRIGVFGGAFDPPHVGHVALARAALEQLQLDALHIIPTGQAWHKARELSPAHHRVAMARLAFADLGTRVQIDEREICRGGPSYTVDTLAALKGEHPAAQLFLILGEDQAQALPTWHKADQLSQFAIICVAARADFTGDSGISNVQHGGKPAFQWLQMPPVPTSATEIRRQLADHQNVAPLVFESVARYIAFHHLYQSA